MNFYQGASWILNFYFLTTYNLLAVVSSHDFLTRYNELTRKNKIKKQNKTKQNKNGGERIGTIPFV